MLIIAYEKVYIINIVIISNKGIIVAQLLLILAIGGGYIVFTVNVNIRMYNFDDVQCTVIPSVAYGFVTGMNLQLC